MILRKPYALLIKNFKLIHIIFTLLSVFLLTKTNNMLKFFGDYILNNGYIIEDFRANELFSSFIIISILFLILLNVVVLILMKLKDKKITFYIVNIVIYICMIILFVYSSSVLNDMQIRIIDTRVVRALRDFYTILMIFQVLSVCLYASRGTGFDVKKFDFKRDLVDLKITEADSEEFEVNVDLDFNKINRGRKRNLRHLKYYYYENKFLADIIFGIIAFVIMIIFLTSSFSGGKKYNQYTNIFNSSYGFKVLDVYVTELDSNEKRINEDKAYILVQLDIKKNTTKEMKINLGRFELVVNNHKYFHTTNYKDYFSDLGNIYFNESLTKEYQKYYLIYQINKTDINSKMYLNYVDDESDVIVNFKPINLDNKKENVLALNEEINLKDTIIGDNTLKITGAKVYDKYELKYKYCLSKDNCISTKEYILPTISTNYDKALLKIDGISNALLENLIIKYGKIEYTIDNKVYIDRLNVGTVKSTKVKQNNTYYFEIKKDVLNASNVSFVLQFRNVVYKLEVSK